MKGYLQIKVDAEAGSGFTEALERSLGNGWRRERESEARHWKRDAHRKEFYFYAREEGRFACVVYLQREDAETIWVRNVIPKKSGELSDAEYNEILREFQREVDRAGFVSLITDEKARLVLSAAAEAKWIEFLGGANATTGSAQPVDRKLWVEFLNAAHRDRCVPSAADLEGYLIEELKWAPRVVENMAREMEFAISLLESKP